MTRQRPDIVFVNQGTPRSYEQASALIDAGYSCLCLTGYYFLDRGWAERLLNLLPAATARRYTAKLKRRYLEHLPQQAVKRSWVQEYLMLLARKVWLVFPALLTFATFYTDLRGAIYVLILRPKFVISADTHSAICFKAAKRVGAVAILDQVIGHVQSGNRTLGAELAAHPEFQSAYRPAPPRLVRRCIREAQTADYIFAPSEYVRDSLLPFVSDPDRVFIIPYGVDVKMFSPATAEPDGPFTILFAGQIGMRKGVYYLLEALRRAGLDNAEAVLLGGIEGSGDWLEPFADVYRHVQHLPHQEIPAVFRQAHIYVYPSLHEGSTVSIYEAMASGLPVITTPNAGAVVRDGEDGFIVPIRDIDGLSERIGRLYRDRELRAEMAKSAAARANEFTWEAYRDRAGRALKKIAEDRAEC